MRLSILIFILLSIIHIHAQKSATVEVSSDSIELGEIIELKYHFENIDEKISLDHLSDLNVISGPSMTSSLSIINGVKSQKIGYTLYIQFDKSGNFVIPGFDINEAENKINIPDIIVKVNGENQIDSATRGNKVAKQRRLSFTVSVNDEAIENNQKPKTERKLRKL